MKKKIMLILVLALVMSLTLLGCGSKEPLPEATEVSMTAPALAETMEPTEISMTAPVLLETEAPTETPTEAPTEPPVLYRNPLNGEPMDAPLESRVFAVTINNSRAALPHVGTTQADLYFEMFVNDFATRGLAFFSDIRQVPVSGSVRSWRYNFTDLCQAYDAYGCHAGGSDVVLKDAKTAGIDHMNVIRVTGISFRDQERLQAGVSREHTLMVMGPEIYAYLEGEGIRVTQAEGKEYHLNFADDGTPEGEDASLINIYFTLKNQVKQSTLTYEEASGKYLYTQYGKQVDSVTEENREPFENVFVILTEVTNSGVYHVADLEGSGEGYYACNGKITKILWHRETAEDAFSFTLEDGTPLVQGVGNSYIAICPLQSRVEWE